LKPGGRGGLCSSEHYIKFMEAGKTARKSKSFSIKVSEGMKKVIDTPEYKKKMSENAEGNKSHSGKTLSEETKSKIGKSNSISQLGSKNSQYGTCWINKSGENKKIKKEQLEDFLNQNWVKGRKIK
jgi:hypothetical protein